VRESTLRKFSYSGKKKPDVVQTESHSLFIIHSWNGLSISIPTPRTGLIMSEADKDIGISGKEVSGIPGPNPNSEPKLNSFLLKS
jgi:hypothetical protein